MTRDGTITGQILPPDVPSMARSAAGGGESITKIGVLWSTDEEGCI
jgi:hypothetical protein